MVDFIRMDSLELCGSRVERELQNVKFLPTVGFEPGTPRLLSERATTELRRLMSTEWIKVQLVFTRAIFRNLHVALGRCNKIIFRELHFVNSLLSANFLIGNSKTIQISDVKNKRQIILLHLTRATGTFLKIAQVKPGERLSTRLTSVFVAQW